MRWVKKPIAAQMKRAQTNMTYVVDGNKCANIVPQGQYFQLINSTIAGRSDGVYTASKVIPANEVIDNTYFNQTSPIAEGAINKISSELTSLNSKIPKYYFESIRSEEIAGNNGSGVIVASFPTGATQILAIIPLSVNSLASDSTFARIVQVNVDTRTISFRTVGTTTQKYLISVLTIYR